MSSFILPISLKRPTASMPVHPPASRVRDNTMRTHALGPIHLRKSSSSPEPTDSSQQEVGPLNRLRTRMCDAAPGHCELVPARANLVTSQASFFTYFFHSSWLT